MPAGAARYRQPRWSLRALVLAAGERAARTLTWREGADGRQLGSRFVALRVRPAGVRLRRAAKGSELPVRWLLAEWPAGEPEPVAYWLASLPADTPWNSWWAWRSCAGGWNTTIGI